MPTTIQTPKATEESTFVITVVFKDEDGTLVIPVSATWSLSTIDGTIINERDSVGISPASSVDIILSGDDLQILEADSLSRVLTIEGTYNSALGSSLPIKDEIYFSIQNLVNVS